MPGRPPNPTLYPLQSRVRPAPPLSASAPAAGHPAIQHWCWFSAIRHSLTGHHTTTSQPPARRLFVPICCRAARRACWSAASRSEC